MQVWAAEINEYDVRLEHWLKPIEFEWLWLEVSLKNLDDLFLMIVISVNETPHKISDFQASHLHAWIKKCHPIEFSNNNNINQ